jgi:hypothetical protein
VSGTRIGKRDLKISADNFEIDLGANGFSTDESSTGTRDDRRLTRRWQ